MSKSTGNLVTIDSFLEKYEANVLRLMILNSSYRGPITFNDDTIQHSVRALKRLRSALKPALPKDGWSEDQLVEHSKRVKELFMASMNDDFNSAGALGHLFDFVKTINQARDEGADQESLEKAQAVLYELTGVFGLELAMVEIQGGNADAFIELLIDIRRKLREEKLWELSDQVRDQLDELGVGLEDTSQRTTWYWK
jgi:cysteinyl-tRNA synthetase